MRKVVVTGATGFLGRHVVEALATRGYEVHAVGRVGPQTADGIGCNVRRHAVDLFDAHSVDRLVADIRPEGLVHLAWTTTPGLYWTDPANESWTTASMRLFEAFSSHGGRHVVVAGTSAEYDWTSETTLKETTALVQPASMYGQSKNSLRLALEAWAPQAGVSWAWGRIFNIYGSFENPKRLIPKSILSLLAEQPLVFDDGLLVRDFLHVTDAAEAFALVYHHTYSGVVNVASGEGVTIRAVLMIIAGHLGRPELLTFDSNPARPGEPRHVVGSSRCLREAVNWSPRLTLRQGLAETCQWWTR